MMNFVMTNLRCIFPWDNNDLLMNLLIEQAVNQVINGHDPSMTLAVGLNSIFLPYGSSSRRITGASSKNTTPCGFPGPLSSEENPPWLGKTTRHGLVQRCTKNVSGCVKHQHNLHELHKLHKLHKPSWSLDIFCASGLGGVWPVWAMW